MLKKTKLAGLVASIVLSSTSFASLLSSSDPAKQLVEQLGNGQVNVVKEFDGLGNLKGFVVSPQGHSDQKAVVYADKDGKYMIPGPIVDSAGNNVAQADYEKYVLSEQSPAIFAAAEKTNWVQDGSNNAPHKVYIMIEPNCIACHMLYKEIKPAIQSGQLAVRWIFVSFMKPQSDGQVAAILQNQNPSAAIAMDESKFNEQTETGGAVPVAVSPATKVKIKQNMDFMSKYNFVGTPVVIYKSNAGSYQVVRGFMPGKANDWVKEMSNQF